MSGSRMSDEVGLEIMRAGSVSSVLSNLYRRILYTNGVDPNRYSALMQRYIYKAHSAKNRAERVTARETLSKELLSPEMTFKTFMKGVVFLQTSSVAFGVRLRFSGRKQILSMKEVELTEAMKDFIELDRRAKSDDCQPVGAILSGIFKEIEEKMALSAEEKTELGSRYLQRTTSLQSGKSKASKVTALSEALKPEITFKTLFKGLLYLDPKSVEFIATLTLPGGKISSTSERVDMTDDVNLDTGEDDGNQQ